VNHTRFIPSRDMPALLGRILAGESLTLAEQRTLVSSHEELRARFLISARMQKALREDLAAEKRRVNEMVSASARMRRA
jgi:hypothetical protein